MSIHSANQFGEKPPPARFPDVTPRLILHREAAVHIRKGINLTADILAPTLGPTQSCVAVARSGGGAPELFDDSATILRRVVSVADRNADVGAMLLRQVIWQFVQRSGDGGATLAVMLRAIFNDAYRQMTAGVPFVELRAGLECAGKRAAAILRSQAQPVDDEDTLARIALTLTANPVLAQVLGEISYILGANASVTIEKYAAPLIEREYLEGAHYPAQPVSVHLYTQPVERKALVNDARVALVEDPINDESHVLPILEAALNANARGIVIIGTAFGERAIATLVANRERLKDKLTITAARLQLTDGERQFIYGDLAALTGAAVVGVHHGLSASRFQERHLGAAQRVEVGTDGMRLMTGNHSQPHILDTLSHLREQLASMSHDAEARTGLVRRIAALNGGTARLRVGSLASREVELLAKQAEVALKVLSSAQREGVVAGGGAQLLHCARALSSGSGASDPAVGILRRALLAPGRQILKNARVAEPELILDLLTKGDPSSAYDVQANRVVDAWGVGLLDSAEILSRAIETAVSGALMALSTNSIVYHRQPEVSVNP